MSASAIRGLLARPARRTAEDLERESEIFYRYLRFGKFEPSRDNTDERGINPIEERYLRWFKPGLRPGETRDMSLGVLGGAYPGSPGGYLAPISFMNKVNDALKFTSDMFKTSKIINTPANGRILPWPQVDDTETSAALVSEGVQVTKADLVTTNANIDVYSFKSEIVLSVELLQDSCLEDPDLEDYLANEHYRRVDRGVTPYLTTGTGSTGSPPQPGGIVTFATAGVTSSTNPAIIGDDSQTTPNPQNQIGSYDLLNLEQSVDPAYRRRGSYMMNTATLTYLRGLRDKVNRPLFPALNDSPTWDNGPNVPSGDVIPPFAGFIFGHRCYENASMAPIGAGAISVLFGDLSRHVIRQGPLTVQRLTERYADYGQVAFIVTSRIGGHLLPAGSPVKYLQNHS
jgi:HK97 family phage major capsid protein